MSLARAEADLAAARNEVRRYENLLENARQKVMKLEHYIEVSRQYAGGHPEEEGPVSRRQRSGISGSAVTEVIAHLREVGRAVKTRDLIPMLKEKGITVSPFPDREVTILSGYLSRAPELTGDRKDGWWLNEWGGPVKSSASWDRDDGGTTDNPRRPTTAAQQGEQPPIRWDSISKGGPDLDDDIPF